MNKKVVILFIIGILASLSFSKVIVSAEENNSIVSTQYVLLDELTTEEKGMIIREKPSIEILHDYENLKLVYEKNIDTETSNLANTTQNLKNTDKFTGDPKKKLPKTGVKIQSIYWIIGFVMILLTINLFIWKRKKLKGIFLVFIIIGLGHSSTVQAFENNLPKNVTKIHAKNGISYSPDTVVKDYNYIGYIYTYLDGRSSTQEGTVTIKYQDGEGNTLSTEDALTGEVGTNYEVEAKQIEGYTLKETIGNKLGQYTKEDQTIVFIYEKEEQLGTVTIKYQDGEGNTLSTEDVLTGEVGTNYEVEAKQIEGYTLKETIGDKLGQYTKEDTIIIFIYDKFISEGTITLNQSGFINATDRGYIKPNFYRVTYYDIDGNILKTEEINTDTTIVNQQITIKIGDTYTVYAKVNYECYSLKTGDRLRWGDYELIADDPTLTKGEMEQSQLIINYTFNDLSYP